MIIMIMLVMVVVVVISAVSLILVAVAAITMHGHLLCWSRKRKRLPLGVVPCGASRIRGIYDRQINLVQLVGDGQRRWRTLRFCWFLLVNCIRIYRTWLRSRLRRCWLELLNQMIGVDVEIDLER